MREASAEFVSADGFLTKPTDLTNTLSGVKKAEGFRRCCLLSSALFPVLLLFSNTS